MMKYSEAVQEVLNHKDCLFFDILIGLHCKHVRRQMSFYGKVKLGFNIARGKWTEGIVAMPSGGMLGDALMIVAEKMDHEEADSNN